MIPFSEDPISSKMLNVRCISAVIVARVPSREGSEDSFWIWMKWRWMAERGMSLERASMSIKC